jgi:glycosyltransferase involved in cell wall biosynthesis
MIWQVLDVRAIWIKEFASALSKQVTVIGWLPQFSSASLIHNREEEFQYEDPPLRIRSFPLQRGFARFPLTILAQEKRRMIRRLSERVANPKASPLICTSPHYAGVAGEWPGPVIYYVTDFFPAYRNEPEFIGSLDRKMCKAATLVCPNSQRIADYLNRDAQCPYEKIVIVPNATRAANLFDMVPATAHDLPAEIADLPRPVAGVIGNLAENTDWVLLRETIDKTPWLSWAFVGPTQMDVRDREQNEARDLVMAKTDRVRFVGEQPYGKLKDYARSFDVAIMPYRKREPTFSGSSTRFYEHLAAGRPMIATRGFAELLHKEPLVKLIGSSPELITALENLRAANFRDGYEELRWQASREGTWEERASRMVTALAARVAVSREAAA